jgi:hypothetical protein
MSERAGRQTRAQAEVVFRAANATLYKRFLDPRFEPADTYPFICECGDERCTRIVSVPLEIYERVREEPTRFLLLPGHEDCSEVVVERDNGYEIVEKAGEAADIARDRS